MYQLGAHDANVAVLVTAFKDQMACKVSSVCGPWICTRLLPSSCAHNPSKSYVWRASSMKQCATTEPAVNNTFQVALFGA